MENNNFKLAILSSFTITGLTNFLVDEFKKISVIPQFYVGAYNQYAKEILDERSGLYNFHPDLIIIFIDTQALLGESFFFPYRLNADERRNWVKNSLADLSLLINTIKKRASAKILVHNLEVPTYSSLGILESKEDFGIVEAVETFNAELRQACKIDNNVFLFDYNNFCSKIGKDNITDPKMYYLGDIKIALNNFKALAHEYTSFIRPLLSLSKKCIVLDLDNTLWGGVIGEDGMSGIKLGPTPEGRSFLEFQKTLLALYEIGLLLAVNSKNNFDDAIKAIREHPNMVLRENHFASVKINWQDKAANLKEIAKDLNIGLDSFVFIDDDKVTRQMVKDFLPEVEVVDLPEDTALYPVVLKKINSLNILQITEEDKSRGAMYQIEKNRVELRNSAKDYSDFIKSLNLTATMLSANSFTVPRISQLTQKTNQFNLTTRRYSENQIEELTKSGDFFISCFQAADKFGDYGITGVAIIKSQNENWIIDTFLLSCRILGKNLEFAIMKALLDDAKTRGVKKIAGNFIPTANNKTAENFYRDCGSAIYSRLPTIFKFFAFSIR